jgi:hypothetical protein
MKKIIIILIAICTAGTLFSQDYFKFPTSDALWNFKIVESMNPPYEWTVIDSLGQNIIIDNQNYIEVYSVGLGDPYVVGAIRDDTLQKKVYFHDFINEIVLYDFSLNVGDTIFYDEPLDYYKTVEDISYININGQERKMLHLLNSLYSFNDYWIEGIGSVYRYGLLYPLNPDIVMDGSTPYFGCFRHESTIYFDESVCQGDCPCTDWLVTIRESINRDKEVTIFPNPTEKNLTIDFANSLNQYNSYEIYSCSGRLILSQEIFNKNQETINIEFLTKGTYYIKLIAENGNDNTMKFIKK